VQLGGDHVLAVHVAAALREHLILELDARDTRSLQLLDGADHLRDLAIARVGVGDHGDRHGRTEAARVVDHLGRARDPKIRKPEGRGGRRIAAAVQRIEARALEQAAREGVEGAGHDQHFAGGEALAEHAPRTSCVAGDQTPQSASVIGKRSCTCSASRR
jgi:hypothetical protein